MSNVPVATRLSQCWYACLLAILIPSGIAAAQCASPFDFENPPYTAGAIITGQPAVCPVADQWYLPAVAGSLDNFVNLYAGNTIGVPPNPNGGLQFCGALGGPVRAQHAINLSAGGVWKVEMDCHGHWGAALPAVNNIGSFSLQNSATTKYFQQLMNWGGGGPYDGPLSPPPDYTATGTQMHIHFGHFTVAAPTAIAFAVPGPEFLNLDVTHWFHLSVEWDFTAAQMLRVSIKDLTANTATVTYDVYGLGWMLQGGLDSTLPLPTDFRLFTGGVNDVAAWDNVNFSQVPPALVGTCCDTITGHCGVSFPAGCADATHIYGGLGSTCAATPCVAITAACCDPAGGCTTVTLANCGSGNIWRGAGSTCADCVVDCNPTPSASCQDRGSLNAYTSNNTTAVCAENFIPTQNTITGGCVSGAYTSTFPPLPASHFRIKYYANGATGLPGTLIASFEEGAAPPNALTVSGPAATPDALPAPGSQPVLSWKFSHASVAVTPGACHWISISNQTTRDWFWDTSGEGESYFVQDQTPLTPFSAVDIVGVAGDNLSFCLDNVAHNQTLNLAGLNGCVVGSCCFNVCPFTCLSNVSQNACTSAATAAGGTATWTAGGSCLTSCTSTPQFCCRGDYATDLTLNGKDIQGLAQALLTPLNCSADPTAFCKLNINEDFQINASASPSPNDVQALVAILLSGGEPADRICGAIPVLSNSSTLVDNTTATTSIFDPAFSLCTPAFDPAFRGEGSVWLKFVATQTTARVDTENSPLTPPQEVVDSILTVFESADGTPGSALASEIACDDDSGVTGTGFTSLVNLTNLTVGFTYYIRVVDYPDEGARGIYRVNVTSP